MEIAVISGKGGTGKSTISAAFSTMSEKVILADCDVDASNMHILFGPDIEETEIIQGKEKPIINYYHCLNCGLCMDHCRFGAITYYGSRIHISDVLCDGCKLCSRVCPYNAIILVNADDSLINSGVFRNGLMISGQLSPGEENTGKIVNLIREKSKKLADKNSINTIILDGPPGIGCPVISTISGVDHVVIITEPSLPAMHDLLRTIELTKNYNFKTWVIINKFDLNPEISEKIKTICQDNDIPIAGELPYDPDVVHAMVNCRSIIEFSPKSEFALKLQSIYKMITVN